VTVAIPALPERRHEQPRLVPNATLVRRLDVTPSLATFTIERDEPLESFAAGQYVSVGLFDAGHLLQRPYSVVSLSGGERVVELFVKRLEGGQLSPRLWTLGAGTRLRLGPARGLFKLLKGTSGAQVLVAAGTGVAPLVAMLAEAREAASTSVHALIHAASYADELVFSDRIEALASAGLKISYRPSVSRPTDQRSGGWAGSVGRAEHELQRLLDEPGFDRDSATFYLCGGGGMVDECTRLLLAAGVDPQRIRKEAFHQGASGEM